MTTPHDSGLRDLEGQTRVPKGEISNSVTDGPKNDGRHASETGKSKEGAEYGDSSAAYWDLYASEAKISDQKFVDTLISDTEAMSIMNSIFSSVIAGFIQQASQALQPNNNQEAVCLLSQLVPHANSTQLSSQFCPGPYPGEPSKALIRANILLVTSFFLAMAIVVACGLIRQWCDDFMKHAYPRTAPHKIGRVRTYLFQGLKRFHMRNIMYGVRVILVVSVVLFSCGLSDYLYTIYPTVGWHSWYCVIAAGMAYVALTISPIIFGNCPYRTALTKPLRFCLTPLFFSGHIIWRRFRRSDNETTSLWRQVRQFDKHKFLVKEANAKADELDPDAMKWLFTDDDFSDIDMDKFLKGLPGYIRSEYTVAKELPEVLTNHDILGRIGEHLSTCVTATELSEEARVKRVSACVESLRVILHLQSNPERLTSRIEEESLRECMQSIVEGLNKLCGTPGEISDLRAFCVRALAFQGFLTKCIEPSLKLEPAREVPPDVNVPNHFIPLHNFFSSVKPQITVSPTAVTIEEPANEDTMKTLLNDGPFVNLTLLAEAIYLHGDDVNPSTLSMCWETLNTLRSEFRITRTNVSGRSLKLFDDTHDKIRRRVRAEEPGFSVGPLLEILDAVDCGRRLSMVFRDHPETKYHSKSDLVFVKDRLLNPDLFRAFAHCLPHFATNNHHGKSVELMEGLVSHDRLWTSLQVHLANSLQPHSSIQSTLHVFVTCCTVIDAAFMALENSEVDWRAPDFGSLAHYFELFVTDCFQGIFIERAIAFRVGLIKARFCNAVLAQFVREFHKKGTVIFRSHWDVASLARVFYSLGVGDDADIKFWKSFVDGGPVDPVFMAKTYTTLHQAERNGPLLNFCRLGRLAMMAVPFKESGVEHTDFKKLLALMQKMTEVSDSRIPLARASPVWELLNQLRDEVADIRSSSSNEDAENMEDLLKAISAAYPPPAQEDHLVDRVQTQRSGTSAVMQSPPSEGLIPGNDRPRNSSTSTPFIEDQLDNSLALDVALEGMTPSPSGSPCGEFPNVFPAPYPFLPPQTGHRGRFARQSFLPALSPHLGRTDVASPGTPFNRSSFPLRSSQHRQSSVYSPPKGREDPANLKTDSLPATPSPPPPPAERLSFPSTLSSNTRFGSSSDEVFSVPPRPPPHK